MAPEKSRITNSVGSSVVPGCDGVSGKMGKTWEGCFRVSANG